MKETITRHYPDGTRATYRLEPGSDAAAALLVPMKPLRTRWARSEKRLYPRFLPGMSTAEYVRHYFELNTRSMTGKPCAYGQHLDHITLYVPLNDSPAATYIDLDSVETIEGDAE